MIVSFFLYGNLLLEEMSSQPVKSESSLKTEDFKQCDSLLYVIYTTAATTADDNVSDGTQVEMFIDEVMA